MLHARLPSFPSVSAHSLSALALAVLAACLPVSALAQQAQGANPTQARPMPQIRAQRIVPRMGYAVPVFEQDASGRLVCVDYCPQNIAPQPRNNPNDPAQPNGQ